MSDAPPAPTTSEAEADTSGMKPFPFHKVKDFKRQACAVSVAGKPVVGDAFFNKSWTPTVKIEGGKLGQLKLTIICQSDASADEGDDEKEDPIKVTFTWYPSFMTETGKFSMNHLHVAQVTKYPRNAIVQNQAVIANFPKGEIDKLIMITFRSRAPVLEGYSEKAWANASPIVKDLINNPGRQEPQNIAFWFKCPHPQIDVYATQCIGPFMGRFSERRSPLSQYYNSKREKRHG